MSIEEARSLFDESTGLKTPKLIASQHALYDVVERLVTAVTAIEEHLFPPVQVQVTPDLDDLVIIDDPDDETPIPDEQVQAWLAAEAEARKVEEPIILTDNRSEAHDLDPPLTHAEFMALQEKDTSGEGWPD